MKVTTETGLKLVTEDELLSEVENIGLEYSPKEYGGFLLEYYADDFKTLTITDILLPNNYRSTSICFERKSTRLEEVCIKYYNKTPSQYYVGEWHTHPNRQPWPSMLDEITIKRIAQNKTIAINNPVMLIIEKYLKSLTGLQSIEIGCAIDYGCFYLNYTGKEDTSNKNLDERINNYYKNKILEKVVFSDKEN